MLSMKDVYSYTDSVFTDIQSINETLYKQLFGEEEVITLNYHFMQTVGSKAIAPMIENLLDEETETLSSDSRALIAKALLAEFSSSWLSIAKAWGIEYDFTDTYSVEYSGKDTRTDDLTNETDETKTSGVYGFDSDLLKNSDSETNKGTSTNSGTVTTEKQYSQHGKNGNFANADLLKKEIDTRRFSLLALIEADIEKRLTLAIYV